MSVYKQHKDRLFRFLFGNEQNKSWTLSLYNAVNGSSYTNPDDIEFNTIGDVLYMGMKNDISFIIANMLNLYEQQASLNPNMPMRQLIYLGMLYGKYVSDEKHPVNLYSGKQKIFPVPKLVCFYNGRKDAQEKTVLHLKDAFGDLKEKSDVDVRVTMYNVNYGKNRELMESCQALREYSWFVNAIRENQKEEADLEKAVDMAIDQMLDTALIKPFILAHRSEVKRMSITEYDEEKTMAMFKEEWREEGREEGRILQLIETSREFRVSEESILEKLMEKFDLSDVQAEAYMKEENS